MSIFRHFWKNVNKIRKYTFGEVRKCTLRFLYISIKFVAFSNVSAKVFQTAAFDSTFRSIFFWQSCYDSDHTNMKTLCKFPDISEKSVNKMQKIHFGRRSKIYTTFSIYFDQIRQVFQYSDKSVPNISLRQHFSIFAKSWGSIFAPYIWLTCWSTCRWNFKWFLMGDQSTKSVLFISTGIIF